MNKFVITLLFVFLLPSSVNASPWSQMLKGGLKGGIKNGSVKNNDKSFTLGKKCIQGNCSEIKGILTTSTDEFTGKTMCISYIKGEGYMNTFDASIGRFTFPITSEKYIQYRLDDGSINSVKFRDLKYFWGYNPPKKADFSYGEGPAFYLKKVLWNRANKLKIRYFQNYSDKIDYTYKTNELNRYVKETRKCWSKHNKDFLASFDKLNNLGPNIEPKHIN